MVPEGWRTTRLEDAGILVIDGDRGAAYPSSGELQPNGYCLFLSAKNVTKNGFAFSDKQFISETKHRALGKGVLQPNDLVLTTRGTVGNVAYYDNTVAFERMRINSGMVIVRPNGGSLDPRFLYVVIRSPLVQEQVERLAFGSAQPQLTVKIVKGLKLPFPPLPEQRKIAEILTTWDASIEITEKLIANAEVQRRGLMQQLLTGKRRLKGFEGQEWKRVSLGQMGTIYGGGTPESEDTGAWGGSINWATPTDITKLSGRYIGKTERSLTEKGLKESAAKLLPVGALLVCTRATIGEMAIATQPIATNQGFKSLVPSASFSVEFIYHLLTFFKHEIIRQACGSTFLELSKKDFSKQTFLAPSKSEQDRIAQVVNCCEDEIEVLRNRKNGLLTEKRALMQQLLTGKRRVRP